MGKANIYLILVVIIIPFFLVLLQNKRTKNALTALHSNVVQTLHILQQKFPQKFEVNTQIVIDENYLVKKLTNYRNLFSKSIVAGGSKQYNNQTIQIN